MNHLEFMVDMFSEKTSKEKNNSGDFLKRTAKSFKENLS